MAFLIALINIVAWALIPLTVRKSPASQIAGMGIGASATALIIYLFTRPAFDLATWAVAFCAGALWTIGQMGQFISFKRIGVSGTIPLSAGF
ncbi:GRP family sugar transporter, partial [Limosilactobacillus pontis]